MNLLALFTYRINSPWILGSVFLKFSSESRITGTFKLMLKYQ